MTIDEYKKIIQDNKKLRMPYPDIICDGDYIVRIEKSMNSLQQPTVAKSVICKRINITEIRSNIDTQERICVLKYLDDAGKEATKEVMRDIISNDKRVIELSRYGIDVTSGNASDVVKHLRNETKRASHMEVIARAGILNYKNRFVFIGGRSISVDKDTKEAQSVSLKYEGKLDIQQHGSYGIYKAMLDSDVIPHTALSTALAVGASSLLVGYIGGEIHIPNILVHLSGDSSTGKSTALQLAISVFGGMESANGKTSLFTSWNSTDNALQEMLAGNNGIAIGLDELGMKQSKNYASMVYRLAEGKEKQRMKFGEGNQDVREWHTAIISTGELPMEDDSDQATGQKVRLIHFESIAWTENASHSERVKDTLQHNYGFLGEILARKLLSHDRNFWKKKHAKESSKIESALQCGALNSRISKFLALIVVSAHMLRWSGIKVSLDSIRQFLIDSTNQTRGESSSIGERAYEKFKVEIIKNQNQIEIRKRNGSPLRGVPAGTIWGTALAKSDQYNMEDWEYVNVPVITVETFLKDSGFNNPNIIFKEWLKRGHIIPSKDKLYHKIKIGNVSKAKCLRFPL